MAFSGFTWNLPVGEAELLLIVLLEVESNPRYSVDRALCTLLVQSLLDFLEVAPDGTTKATSGANSTKEARLDGYRDRRRRLR